ncbi:MAG: zinc-ribbon domain-containing protein [Deltaproteobacteria bacterium]|nr:zinc-ribbon domain-containing protein [Deltaproteobacteria bacterium]
MECPHCHNEIASKECPQCGTSIPEESLYCMQCGAHLDEDEPFSEEIGEEDLDFEDRELCPDGTCTGIMINGKCSECGRSSEDGDVSE